jgi:hypothetical protein
VRERDTGTWRTAGGVRLLLSWAEARQAELGW